MYGMLLESKRGGKLLIDPQNYMKFYRAGFFLTTLISNMDYSLSKEPYKKMKQGTNIYNCSRFFKEWLNFSDTNPLSQVFAGLY